jgi:hypothetical protein
MGTREVDLGGPDLGELTDSTPLLENAVALRARLAEDGYLLLRGAIDRHHVLAAGAAVLSAAEQQGWLSSDGRGRFLGDEDIARSRPVLDVLEAPALFDLFGRLFGEPALTFPYKWMRLVGRTEFTGAHIDRVYMSRGSSRLTTAWIPLGDVPLERGPLAVCLGSHRLDGFDHLHDTYGEVDVDRDMIDGIFTSDPLEVTEAFGGRWCTSSFAAGDILVFSMRTMHASLSNTSDGCRISCDVRFQPATEPTDERWVGQRPVGHYNLHSGRPYLTVAEARPGWEL